MNNEPEFKTGESLAADGEQTGNIAVKRNKIADFVAKICCFIIAFFLWFYAAGNESVIYEQTFSDIPVDIVNRSHFSVLSGADVTVDLTLSGKRSILKKLENEDIRAYVDMSAITEAGPHIFEVQYELPNGVTLEKTSSSRIQIYADNTATLAVPVRVDLKAYRLENDYVLDAGAITTSPRTVTVSGPEAVIQNIAYARLTADLGGASITGTVTYTNTVILIDSEGNEVKNPYVETNVSTVTARIPVYKYRDVPIEVTYRHGFFHSGNCDITVEPATVRIRGEADVVDAVKLTYEIDEKAIRFASVSYTVNVSLPSVVTNLNAVETATIAVNLKNMSFKTFRIYDIRVTNNPNGLLYDPVLGPLTVTVCGDSTLVSRMTTADLWADADLSSFHDNSEATIAVPVTIGFADAYFGKVYETLESDGVYTVSVHIRTELEGGV